SSGTVPLAPSQPPGARPPGWIGPPRSPIEPRGHAGTRAGVFEQANVLLRGPAEAPHSVEAHAVRGALQDSADDLQALPALARGREQLHRLVFTFLRR